MSTESTEALIERVLAEHEWNYPDSFCKCSAWVSLDTPWTTHVAAAITQALAEREAPSEPDLCGLELGDGWTCELTAGHDDPDTHVYHPRWTTSGWAEDAAASHRALYDTDSGRRDNWSER